MAKKIKLPESPLKDMKWPLTRAAELILNLETQRQIFEDDRSHALPAFFALTLIMAEIWKNPETPRNCDVTIPLWLVETLAEGFCRYQDSAEKGASITFGEAYGIEGGGQGKKPRISIEFRELRDIRLATKIAFWQESGGKIEAILQELSDETDLSLGQIRRIWEKHKRHALKSIKNLQTRISS